MQPRKPIAIDLDGVVVDLVSVMLPKLSELAGRTVTAEDIKVFEIGQALGLTRATMAELWDWLEREQAYAHAPPIEGAVQALHNLGRERVSFMTSRPKSVRDQTLEWLRDHGLGEYQLEMGLPAHKVVRAGDFFALVEDNATHLASVASRVQLVLLYDQPWNRAAPTLPNMVRVQGWAEILRLLNRGH
jgi:uncharacterized HAD superfamily protein